MNEERNYKFHVIELSEPPYTDPERYVCVPNSWISIRDEPPDAGGLAVVRFPIEDLSDVKRRAKNEEYSPDWKVFVADVKYSSNSYKDASDYIKILNKIDFQEQTSTKIAEGMPSTSGTIRSAETKEVHSILTISDDATKLSNERVTDAQVETCLDQIKDGNVDTSPKSRRYTTRQSLKMSSSSNNTSTLDQTVKETRPETSNGVKENKTDHNQKIETSVISSPEIARNAQVIMALRLVLGDDFREALKKLHNKFERNHLILEKMRLAFVNNCKILEELIKLTDEVNGADVSDLEATVEELGNSVMNVDLNKTNVVEETRSEKENDAQKEEKSQNIDHAEAGPSSQGPCNSLNKIRGQLRKFNLPPEYDPKDSRWTLKHREKKNGVVELLPRSRVYIDGAQLTKCKITSTDTKTLARKLFLEIFSENALSVCSLTGKRANAFNLEGTDPRPGLDEHARTVLLKYVEKHSVEQKWARFDKQIILNTLRNKLQEMRGKC